MPDGGDLARKRSCIWPSESVRGRLIRAVASPHRAGGQQSPSPTRLARLRATTTHFGVVEPNCADREAGDGVRPSARVPGEARSRGERLRSSSSPHPSLRLTAYADNSRHSSPQTSDRVRESRTAPK